MWAMARESAIVFIVITHDRCTECADTSTNRSVPPSAQLIIAASLIRRTQKRPDVLLEKARTLNPDKAIDAAKVWSGVRN